MPTSKYRFKSPCTAVLRDPDGIKITVLPVGSIFFPVSGSPDEVGMVAGSWDGHSVSVFACDLEERAQREEIRHSPASVRIVRGADSFGNDSN